jgi:hypothetical protein
MIERGCAGPAYPVRTCAVSDGDRFCVCRDCRFFSLQEGEIWNGRIAMIAILAFVVQEAVTKVPTAATIPFF